jgi:chromosome segregation ATPase
MNTSIVHPVDLDQLGEQVNQLSRTPVDLHALERDISSPLPAVTLKQTQVQADPDIGKLSADAVLEQYNMAAKAVEAMGEEVQKRIRALEDAMKDCDEDMRLLREAADSIREKGQLAHAEIERTSAVSKDIREIVAAIKAKIAN